MQPEPISLKYGTELPVCIDLAVEGQQAEQGYPFPSLRLLLSLPFSVKIPKVTWKVHNPLSFPDTPFWLDNHPHPHPQGSDPNAESWEPKGHCSQSLSTWPTTGGDTE